MSLIPFAVRICTVRALQAALPASVAVVDSPQEPLTLLDIDEPRPIVAVYTGATVTKYEGRNFLGGMSSLSIAIQIMLPEVFSFGVGAGSITIDTRRQGAETALDVLWRKAELALNASIEPWAALWREFVLTVPSVENLSFLIERNGVKVTAREVQIKCDPIHEPIPGGAPTLAWASLLANMRADNKDDGLHYLADWIESEIRGGANKTQPERDAIYLGLSAYVAKKIGIPGPIEDVQNQTVTPVIEVVVDDVT